MMKDIERKEKLANLENRADQVASLTLAVSNAATYAPDDPGVYLEAWSYLASATRKLANDIRAVITE